MATPDAETLFVDTNVLVYASVVEAPLHEAALQAIQAHEQAGEILWISRQVLREYLATLTRPGQFPSPPSIAILMTQVRHFTARFHVADEGPLVTEQLLGLLTAVSVGGKKVHDANIVATMQVYGIRHLLTHNVDDFTRFAAFVTVVPLVPWAREAS
jgi:predicted nucleic acid-binding protein